ncbi:hypothetical protein C1N81_05270 (plasmid) [Streptomyces sp. SGAir0957]
MGAFVANGVWHSGIGKILELDKSDLGLGTAWPDLPELFESLLQPVATRDRELLVCVESSQGEQCKAELSGVKSPHMYVRKHRGPDGALRLRAVHLPTTHEMTAEESDRHKAMKDFLARTGQSAGIEFRVEKATKNRTSRPDVTLIGTNGVSLGCEAQYYNASAGTVLRRSKAHADAGLVANWITHDDRFHLIDRANWMLTREMTWREIDRSQDIALTGGFRVLVEWQCTASAERPCPNGLLKTGCGKVHLQWETPRRLDDEGTGWTGYKGNTQAVMVGQTLIGAVTGTVAPLFASSRRDRRSGAYMWVSTDDRARWNDYQSGETPTFQEPKAPDEDVQFSGRDAETTCTFGDDTWIPSAPLERRGIYGVELTLTADASAPTRDRPTHGPPNAGEALTVATGPTAELGVADAPARPLLPRIPPQQRNSAPEAFASVPEGKPALQRSNDGTDLTATDSWAAVVGLQEAANREHVNLGLLDSYEARTRQRAIWFEAAAAAQQAITEYANIKRLNRFDVELEVRRAAKDRGGPSPDLLPRDRRSDSARRTC